MKEKKTISNIVRLGLVSLFADMSTEMVYPIIPIFLTATLGATPAIVGVIEGIAESIASILKVFSGYIGDVYRNKKHLAIVGYSATGIYKILLIIAASWPGVLIARIVDRTGKGIRTAPRDALVAQSSSTNKLGGSFGLHKMLDMAGSALGVVLAFLFVSTGFGYHKAFLLSIIPAVIAVLVLLTVKEKRDGNTPVGKFSFRNLKLSPTLKIYLTVIFIFCIGNSSNAFLLLKAQEQGFSASQVILLYLAFNVSASALAIPAGKLSDKLGRSRILLPGYFIYGAVYLGFAFLSAKPAIWVLFLAYGAYNALISGAERAFICENAPAELRGTVLGLYGTLQGIGLLLSSVIAGILWDRINSSAPFIFGGLIGILSAVLIWTILGVNSHRPRNV